MSKNKTEKITVERRIIRVDELLNDFKDWSIDSIRKILFSLKPICALIIKGLIPDFKNVSLKEIKDIYLTDPEDPVNPYIKLLETELNRKGETLVDFDLRFEVNSPYNKKYIIELEIQKNDTDYELMVRASVYVSKLLVSEQYKLKVDYNLIGPAMSVWINNFKSPVLNYPIIRWTLSPELIQSGIDHPFKVLGPVPDLKNSDLLSIFMINLKAKSIDGIEDPMITQLRHLLNKEYDEFKEFLEKNDLGDWDEVKEVIEMYTTVKEEGIKIGEGNLSKFKKKQEQLLIDANKIDLESNDDSEFRNRMRILLKEFKKDSE